MKQLENIIQKAAMKHTGKSKLRRSGKPIIAHETLCLSAVWPQQSKNHLEREVDPQAAWPGPANGNNKMAQTPPHQ